MSARSPAARVPSATVLSAPGPCLASGISNYSAECRSVFGALSLRGLIHRADGAGATLLRSHRSPLPHAAYAPPLHQHQGKTMTDATEIPKARTLDMKFEIVVLPVSDVDRAKRFYGGLGWRLDADFAASDDFRVIQFTPPGSACSVIFGKNVTAAAPGCAQGLYLIVSDIETARNDLLARGVKVSEVFTMPAACTLARTSPICLDGLGLAAWIPNIAATARSPRSAIRTATAGCSRKSPPDCRTRGRQRHDVHLLDRARGCATACCCSPWRAREAHRGQAR